MKTFFFYNFRKCIVSNRLIFSLICTFFFISALTFIAPVEGLQITVTSEKVTDVDPNTPGDQPGVVWTFVTLGEGELDTSVFRIGGVSYDEYTGFKSFTKVNDNTYKLTVGPVTSSEDSTPPPENSGEGTPTRASSTRNVPASASQQRPRTAPLTSPQTSTGNDPTPASQQEQSTDPATSTGNGAGTSDDIGGKTPTSQPAASRASSPATSTGNGTAASGNTGVPTSTPQRAAPRVAKLLIISGNVQTAKADSLLHPFVLQVNDQYGNPMSDVPVTFSVSGDGRLSETSATTDADGRAQTQLTLGSTPGTYRVTAQATGTSLSQTFTAEATPRVLSHLAIQGEARRSVYIDRWFIKPLQVQVLDTDNDPVSGVWVTFSVVSESTGTAKPETRGGLSDARGLARARFMPLTPGTLLVDATAEGVPPVRFTLTASLPPARIVKISGDDQQGVVDATLKEPFAVEVLNKNDAPVPGATVRFSVAAGGGRLSATRVLTDSQGRAETQLRLGREWGVSKVEASIPGVGRVPFTSRIVLKVPGAGATHPVMYWIEKGRLYRFAGSSATEIAENANSIAISDEKIYWTAQTSEAYGTLNSANLDGTGATELRSVWGVPVGLAVDTTGSKLYWTDAVGRLQRADLDGSNIQNVLRDLPSPMAIALLGGTAYWTQGDGRIGFVSLTGEKQVRHIATETDALGGLALGGGKVYWTAQTSQTRGTLNSANLDGTDITELRSVWGVPIRLAVDTVESKLYWTDGVGRLQRSTLDGSSIENVIKGLGSPGELVLDTRAAGVATAPTAMMRTLMHLQQPLAPVRPERTQLLSNYPNPFNPETWIPYELATDTDVKIRIYDTQGIVIRTLLLGPQSAGYYISRDRAAYWDGRNAFGEHVASGVYFYQLETDEMSSMRKMVILK